MGCTVAADLLSVEGNTYAACDLRARFDARVIMSGSLITNSLKPIGSADLLLRRK